MGSHTGWEMRKVGREAEGQEAVDTQCGRLSQPDAELEWLFRSISDGDKGGSVFHHQPVQEPHQEQHSLCFPGQCPEKVAVVRHQQASYPTHGGRLRPPLKRVLGQNPRGSSALPLETDGNFLVKRDSK